MLKCILGIILITPINLFAEQTQTEDQKICYEVVSIRKEVQTMYEPSKINDINSIKTTQTESDITYHLKTNYPPPISGNAEEFDITGSDDIFGEMAKLAFSLGKTVCRQSATKYWGYGPFDKKIERVIYSVEGKH